MSMTGAAAASVRGWETGRSPADNGSRSGRGSAREREPQIQRARRSSPRRPRIQCERSRQPIRARLVATGRSPRSIELIGGHHAGSQATINGTWPRARIRDRCRDPRDGAQYRRRNGKSGPNIVPACGIEKGGPGVPPYKSPGYRWESQDELRVWY